jgi:hypothetical protein
MHRLILVEGAHPGLGELHEIEGQEEASYWVIGHGSHGVGGKDSISPGLPGHQDHGSVVDLVGRTLFLAVPRYEDNYPSLESGEPDLQISIGSDCLIHDSSQIEARAADDGHLGFHVRNFSSNL